MGVSFHLASVWVEPARERATTIRVGHLFRCLDNWRGANINDAPRVVPDDVVRGTRSTILLVLLYR